MILIIEYKELKTKLTENQSLGNKNSSKNSVKI